MSKWKAELGENKWKWFLGNTKYFCTAEQLWTCLSVSHSLNMQAVQFETRRRRRSPGAADIKSAPTWKSFRSNMWINLLFETLPLNVSLEQKLHQPTTVSWYSDRSYVQKSEWCTWPTECDGVINYRGSVWVFVPLPLVDSTKEN